MMKHPVPGAPSSWLAYVLVSDIHAATAKAKSLGAKIMKDVTEVPGMGVVQHHHRPDRCGPRTLARQGEVTDEAAAICSARPSASRFWSRRFDLKRVDLLAERGHLVLQGCMDQLVLIDEPLAANCGATTTTAR